MNMRELFFSVWHFPLFLVGSYYLLIFLSKKWSSSLFPSKSWIFKVIRKYTKTLRSVFPYWLFLLYLHYSLYSLCIRNHTDTYADLHTPDTHNYTWVQKLEVRKIWREWIYGTFPNNYTTEDLFIPCYKLFLNHIIYSQANWIMANPRFLKHNPCPQIPDFPLPDIFFMLIGQFWPVLIPRVKQGALLIFQCYHRSPNSRILMQIKNGSHI